MAQVFQPRQRKSDKRWDYTVSSDEERWCHAIGWCAGWTETPLEELQEKHGEALGRMIFQERENRRPFKDRYHDTGHATAEEAQACYRDYLLTEELELLSPPAKVMTKHKCELCDEFTAGAACIRGGHWRRYFCDAHRTLEQVRAFARNDKAVW